MFDDIAINVSWFAISIAYFAVNLVYLNKINLNPKINQLLKDKLKKLS